MRVPIMSVPYLETCGESVTSRVLGCSLTRSGMVRASPLCIIITTEDGRPWGMGVRGASSWAGRD